MLYDMITVARKDLSEFVSIRGTARSGFIYLLLMVGVMGVMMPITSGRLWLSNPVHSLSWSWFTVLLVISVITDSFAGERERNTLETLLASRLSDKAILYGKILAAVLYGWVIAVISNLVAVITVNISDPGPRFEFYSPVLFIVLLVVPFLTSLFVSAIGVLVSLNAPTTRSAYQRLSLAFFVIFILPIVAFNFTDAVFKEKLLIELGKTNWMPVALIAIVVMAILAAILIWVATRRFQRSRLIVD